MESSLSLESARQSEVQSRTAVPFERQKFVGLVKGKLPPDDAIL